LKNNFPNRSNERELDDFCEEGASLSVHFVRTNIKDLTDFLLCVLRKSSSEISLDDEEYIITCSFKNKNAMVTFCILITRVDENVLAVEFNKLSGDRYLYHEKVK
jgi:hypothetical protein